MKPRIRSLSEPIREDVFWRALSQLYQGAPEHSGVRKCVEGRTLWTSFVGFVASGKSTLAEVLGRGMGLPTVDLDREVEKRVGKSLPDIFGEGGVQGFRSIESNVLSDLSPTRPLLMATGAGTVEREANRALLSERGVIVWLDAPWEILRARIEEGAGQRRQVVDHLGWDGLRRLYLRRARIYAQIAHFRLRTDRLDVGAAARHAMLRSLVWRRRREGAVA